MFTRAIVRPPAMNFADGLSGADLGNPDYEQALAQHAHYCEALEQCGLTLTRLEPDARFPDSTFIEDTAILTASCAILTRPGAPSRADEVADIAAALSPFYSRVHAIAAPGTIDGGDVCQAGQHFLIGISQRTNEEGARQLAALLAHEGFTSVLVDIRDIDGILHLKSGISYLGDGRMASIEALAGHPAFRNYSVLRVAPEESYAANFLRINDRVIVSAGYPQFAASVRALGYSALALDMSEFRKMDGAPSCLSLRF
jgi:dimethylargininase